MLLLSGPAGSGKTTRVLEGFREALHRGTGARLLVPTATLAQHLQHRLAHEGLVFPPHLVQTLSGFVDEFAADLRPVRAPALYLIVEDVVRRTARAEFAPVAGLAGFSNSLARAIEEFASAGCDATRLARDLPEAPLAEAFLAVYGEVEHELARRGLSLRAARLAEAARRITAGGAGPVTHFWLDGFHALPDPELDLIRALAARALVTLTLTLGDAAATTRTRLLAMGFEETRLPARRPAAARVLMHAPGVESEAAEIARRILEQHRAGRPFREIGVIVRTPHVYVPVLRSTFDRFAIPAHFYFDEPLDTHPVARFVGGAVDAMLSGWDHQKVLDVLRLAPRLADSARMDRFDFDLRLQMPASGLGPLRALIPEGFDYLQPLIAQLASLEEWRNFALTPAAWAERARTLRRLFHPARPPASPGHSFALALRAQSQALDQFEQALDDAALALPAARPVDLETYWRAAKSALRLTPLRLEDGRRDVVHIIAAHEARQWELPVVFVCGLVERQFPSFHPQDPFFGEPARHSLNARGIRLRAAADFELDERALFDSAVTRATLLLVLSYPEFDQRGERNLPSMYLDGLLLAREAARAIRPRPRAALRPPPPVAIAAAPLIDHLRARTAVIAPTALEQFFRCPYQYFAGKVLRLEAAPARPALRLDYMLQGSIVHRVLQEWWTAQPPLEPLFDRIFTELCEENGVPSGFRAARLHDAMLRDLQAFAADTHWPPGRLPARTEEKFELALDDTVAIRGKIDRIDVDAEGRAWIIDYKYSAKQGTQDKLDDEDLVQAPLYCLGAERALGLHPAGMFYIGLRGGVAYAGWGEGAPVAGEPIAEGWTANAVARAIDAVGRIRQGHILPHPSDPIHCQRCNYNDVCRYETAAEARVEAAG